MDYPYNTKLDISQYFQLYAETLRGVDDSIGRVLDYLKSEGLLESTLVIYMGDNGFAFGEHGLIDKRTAYEESMRVPMVMQCPELFSGGKKVPQVVANLDIAPTVLAAAGLQPPAYMEGASMLPLAQGQDVRVAQGTALRVLLGTELPADADGLRVADRPVQVHPLLRRVGHRRVVRHEGRLRPR